MAWRRQVQLKSPFSRRYWTRQRRPRLKTLQYNTMMILMMSLNGLVVNRDEGRSGILTLSPIDAMVKIKAAY